LKERHGLDNLELHELSVERASHLEETFDHVVCTGVLHHLADPDVGLAALHGVLVRDGALHVMVYAPYGRAGVYLLQDYCKKMGIGWSAADIADLTASLNALPADHPIVPLLRHSPDFASEEGIADALLHPRDRAFSVPQLMDYLERGGFVFGRWLRQAPYLVACGAIASTPHASRLAALPSEEQYAALELFRGTMTRHSVIAYRRDRSGDFDRIDFTGDDWRRYVPIRLPNTIAVRERLPQGASAVLINRDHTFTDLYLPIGIQHERMLAGVDGAQNVEAIYRACSKPETARDFFRQLWQFDQIAFDTSAARGAAR
jgi:SAM-dependent methyltransferase